MSSILVFDTETNGKPKRWGAPVTDVENWPRVTQLAWHVFNFEGAQLDWHGGDFLITPDGWEIPDEPFFVEHNMSTERCILEGFDIKFVLQKFCDEINKANVQYLVAHNIEFDQNVLGAEMIRCGVNPGRQIKKICTMKQSASFVGLYRNKWPKLEELHNKLFGVGFEGAHYAFNDIVATAKCFFELKRLGVISIS